ncbi:MAG: hypothetical protein SW833_17420 [Cyanobacteriota bacterium]|nr:hypothetical protein [Cyanobacteriota bacterium]
MAQKKVTDRNTKAEILEAYETLRKEKSSLESQVKKLNATPMAAAAIATLPTEPAPSKNGKITTSNAQIEQTIQNLEKLHISFGGAVSNLSEKLIAEASTLEEIQEGVNEETQILIELHQLKEIEDTTLETLIQSYQESAKTFEEELSERRETLDGELQDLKQSWKKEQEAHQRNLKERNEAYQKQTQRDEEEYQYNLELDRALNEEEYEQQKKQNYKELEAALKTQKKQWNEREQQISEQEKQYAEAKQKVEEFKQELEKNIKNGKENGRNIGYYNAKVKSDLRAKEVEGAKQNYELRVESLQQTIQTQETRIHNLSKQLDAALKQVQDLAVKAIEGTSNRNSFDAVKQIAIEQAKNQQKNK